MFNRTEFKTSTY